MRMFICSIYKYLLIEFMYTIIYLCTYSKWRVVLPIVLCMCLFCVCVAIWCLILEILQILGYRRQCMCDSCAISFYSFYIYDIFLVCLINVFLFSLFLRLSLCQLYSHMCILWFEYPELLLLLLIACICYLYLVWKVRSVCPMHFSV
jgi:hypothetical protein